MIFFRFRNLRLRQLRQERKDTQATLKAAERRGDTRAICAARLALRAATHRLMEAENA